MREASDPPAKSTIRRSGLPRQGSRGSCPQVRSWAEALAKRVQAEGKDASGAIARAYAICFSRAPTSEEAQTASAFVAQQSESYTKENKPDATSLALADFCQVLFGLNEFVYQP